MMKIREKIQNRNFILIYATIASLVSLHVYTRSRMLTYIAFFGGDYYHKRTPIAHKILNQVSCRNAACH